MHPIFRAPGSGGIPIYFIDAASVGLERDGLAQAAWNFARAAGFEAKPGRVLLLPGKTGAAEIGGVLFGTDAADPFGPGRLPGTLPPGTYRFVNAPDPRLAALAFALGSYQ
jgi:leucyl aminopeptidase